ncbi:MAG: ribosome biogenesis GTPase YlqF [Oscillospiraceae bacterium]|nr:ribosome biogenesis GTPase YlqF [Oscillospiraceae bacterium]
MHKTDSINWFPGHMAKAYRLVKLNLSRVDGVIELLDARAPVSSKSPQIEKVLAGKPRIILLNKSDLADPGKTEFFKTYLGDRFKVNVVALDSSQNDAWKRVLGPIELMLSSKSCDNKRKGMFGRTLKLMVLGIPNVGKSTLINRCAHNKKAKVENRPGVTRSEQWVALAEGIELLDTPGVLWPKFEERLIGINLALIGSVKESILDLTGLALELLERLKKGYPACLQRRYALDEKALEKDPFGLLCDIGVRRRMLMRFGEVDIERTARMLLSEFRAGLIGKITLDELPVAP